jgi:hypothetical protein
MANCVVIDFKQRGQNGKCRPRFWIRMCRIVSGNGSPRRLGIAITFAVSLVATWSLGPMVRLALAQQATPWMDAQRLLASCSSPTGSFESNSCGDYVEGVKDILNYLREHRISGVRLPCMPSHVTLGQLQDVTVRFIRNNPQFYHLSAAPAVYAALVSAFPCE